MVKPLLRNFPPRAFPHGLFHIITGNIRKQSVYPHHQLILGLILEMRLSVQSIAHQPLGILHRDNTPGHHLAAEGISLADFLYIRRDPVIQCSDGCRFPIGSLGIGAEFIRMAEGRILGCDVAPQLPAAAYRIIPDRRVIIIPQGRILRSSRYFTMGRIRDSY